MAKMDTLQDLFVHTIKDLYSAEQQLIDALPKMAKAAKSERLRKAFADHFAETQQQLVRLEAVFERLDMKPQAHTCKGMKGLIAEGEEMLNQDGDPAVIDAGLIAAAQRVEHYEIAAYGCARTYAERLGDNETADILQETLDEEKATDEKLTELAESTVNPSASKA